MTDSRYHKTLRSSLLVFAFILVFDSGIVTPLSKHLSDNTLSYLANSVGVFAQIEPNELNVLTAELTARQRELEAREAALREIEARAYEPAADADYSVYALSFMVFLLTVLIVANYFLDWHRARLLRLSASA